MHCPILSVRHLVEDDCTVTFTKHGGFIPYPNGTQIRFVLKDGCFFVAMNVLPPGAKDAFGRKECDEALAKAAAPPPEPVFSRPGRA